MDFIKKQLKNNFNEKINYIFLFFVLLTLLLWFLNKLSKQYTTVVAYPITYQSLPNQFVFQEVPPQKIPCRVQSNGFYFFRLAFYQPRVNLQLASLKRQKKYQYYLPNRALKSQMITSLPEHINLIEVVPDTLFLQLGKKSFKKVPIQHNALIEYQLGYKSFSGISVIPDSIEISGPEMQVAQINQIALENFVQKNVQTSINQPLEIVKSKLSKIAYSHEQVQLKVTVEKITEKTMLIPVQITNAINKQIVVYPKKVKVVCQVRLSEFNKIKASDFTLVCDYSQRTKKHIKIKVMQKPAIVSSVKLSTDKVEYLILK